MSASNDTQDEVGQGDQQHGQHHEHHGENCDNRLCGRIVVDRGDAGSVVRIKDRFVFEDDPNSDSEDNAYDPETSSYSTCSVTPGDVKW